MIMVWEGRKAATHTQIEECGQRVSRLWIVSWNDRFLQQKEVSETESTNLRFIIQAWTLNIK